MLAGATVPMAWRAAMATGTGTAFAAAAAAAPTTGVRHSLAAAASVAGPSRCGAAGRRDDAVATTGGQRSIHTTAVTRAAATNAGGTGGRAPAELRDEAIRARIVRLVDPETGSLAPVVYNTRELLANIDRSRYWIVQVKAQAQQQQEEGQGAGEGPWRDAPRRELAPEEMAIVKLVDKKEAYDRQRAAKRARGASSSASAATGMGAGVSGDAALKEVQLTWASTAYDMEHKLAAVKTSHMMRRGPGAVCKVVVSPQARNKAAKGPSITPDDKRQLCERIETFVCDWTITSEQRQEHATADDGGGAAAAADAAALEGQQQQQQSNRPAKRPPGYHARRRGDIEWRGGKRMASAVLHFEVVKL